MFKQYPQPTRRPVQRVFRGLAGSALAVVSPITEPQPARRGRPRQYQYATEAERKRVSRAAARQQIEELLAEYGLNPASEIPAELKTKHGIRVATFGELLQSQETRDKLLTEIAADLGVVLGTVEHDPDEPFMFMSNASRGKGRLVTGGYDSEKCSEILGHQARESVEDELIQAIDGNKSSKLLARQFLAFLKDRNLSIESLKNLSVGEQRQLKTEFLARISDNR
jgi:hypothetical protein